MKECSIGDGVGNEGAGMEVHQTLGKREDHHHRSGEEEPLVERRKEGLSLSIKKESESVFTFYQERK